MAGPVMCGKEHMLHGKNCPATHQRTAFRRSHSRNISLRPILPSCSALQIHAAPVHIAKQRRLAVCKAAATIDVSSASTAAETQSPAVRPFKVVVAGGGIGGLVLALALLKKGVEVKVLERDVTAIRGEGKYRGPIQVQSNALAALEAIDMEAAEEVMRNGCITGDRINGLCDGVSGDWYVKFDTFHPAVDAGLPVTRVISRVTLQEILMSHIIKQAGPSIITGSSTVVGFEESPPSDYNVRVIMQDGSFHDADLLVGADGIWSNIRKLIVGDSKANYSGYTCYTGISDFTPADIELVAYRVYLGNGQYFVSSDVGGGKMQWYGFHKEAAGGTDLEGQRKGRLLDIFGHWCDDVTDLIKATPEADVLRRDIFDRAPIFQWAKGSVVLLGDSAHAMQPNLGQGGCMAIEDAHQLAVLLDSAVMFAGGDAKRVDVRALLKEYQDKRMMRASAIHGMAGMAASMASTYKAYLGEGLGPVGKWMTQFKVPHPGRVAGQVLMKLTMPSVLSWVLGGNDMSLRATRVASCRIGDKNRFISEEEFAVFMQSDQDLVRAMHADWLLVPEGTSNSQTISTGGSWEGVRIGEEPVVVGRREVEGDSLPVDDVHVNPQHAEVFKQGLDYFVRDLDSVNGTFLNGERIAPRVPVQLHMSDVLEFGRHPKGLVYKVKARHLDEAEEAARLELRAVTLQHAEPETAGVLV